MQYGCASPYLLDYVRVNIFMPLSLFCLSPTAPTTFNNNLNNISIFPLCAIPMFATESLLSLIMYNFMLLNENATLTILLSGQASIFYTLSLSLHIFMGCCWLNLSIRSSLFSAISFPHSSINCRGPSSFPAAPPPPPWPHSSIYRLSLLTCYFYSNHSLVVCFFSVEVAQAKLFIHPPSTMCFFLYF